MTTVTTTMHITMDPHFDLSAAGLPAAEADALYAAWTAAVEALAEVLGADITTARALAGSPDDQTTCTIDADDEVLETTIWQAAHDAVTRHGDGTWTADTERAANVGQRLRDRIV